MSPKTEKEKMLAGERYNILDPGLEIDRQKAKKLMRLYNQSDETPERQDVLEQMLGTVGQDTIIWPPFYCTYGKNIHLGAHVFINYMCVIIDNNEVRIGDHVMIGPSVHIYTAAHDLQAKTRIQGWEVAKPVTIEENVWIGGGAIILPGVSIGRNAVIGAGAVVTRDVAADTVVAGNPAKLIRVIEQE